MESLCGVSSIPLQDKNPPFSPSNSPPKKLYFTSCLFSLAIYTSRGTAPLHLSEVSLYTPSKLEAGDAEWKGIFRRLTEFADDGHAVKFGRAVANAERLCEPYEKNGEGVGVLNGFMWEKIGNMVVDSVEDTGATWARNVGWEEAWKDYEDRPRKSQL